MNYILTQCKIRKSGWMIGETVRHRRRWTSADATPARNWSLHPMAIEVGCFWVTEKYSFRVTSQRAEGQRQFRLKRFCA